MNLYLRLLWVLVRGALRPRRRSALDASILRMRVLPNDLDLNRHMNNGRFLTLMDLGRVDLMLGAGLLGTIVRRGWMPVVAAATIRFRRSLDLFDAFTLRTRVVCWDERWVWLEQRFERDHELVAHGLVKAAIRARGGVVPPFELLASLGERAVSPPPPPMIARWEEAIEAKREGAARSA
jgi:acyl-CoA thioesterase FadM